MRFISGTLSHVYSSAGTYTALIDVSNLVSHENSSIDVVVQDPVASKQIIM